MPNPEIPSTSRAAPLSFHAEDNNFELGIHQFQAAISNETSRIDKSDNKRVSTTEQLTHIEKAMRRVFDRSTALLAINIQTWEEDRTIVTEVGISIYDPQRQALAMMPHIKSYHFLVKENREFRNGKTIPDHSKNFSGGTSYLFTAEQTRQLIDGLMCHYFGPDFPLSCLLVGHRLEDTIKLLENIRIFIHPKVPKLDTQVLFSQTHGPENSVLKHALSVVNQPYAFLFNAGNKSYYTTLLALKLCDPMVRRLTGIDYLKKNEKRDRPVKYVKRSLHKSSQKTIRTKEELANIVRVGVSDLSDED